MIEALFINSTTNIKFINPQDQMISVKIYNIHGQLVQELCNRKMRSGEVNLPFHAANLAAGQYMYQIQMENATEMKKILYLK